MMNKEGGSANIDEIVKKNNNPLSLDQFKSYINDGYTVLDTRGFVDYLSGFVPKSYNVDLGQSFALWVGKLMTPEKKFVLICDNGREKEAVQRLCRIGYDNVKGIHFINNFFYLIFNFNFIYRVFRRRYKCLEKKWIRNHKYRPIKCQRFRIKCIQIK